MSEHLCFRLYGPLAAWGGIAVGEQRPSEGHPTRSAVLGLIAAALGYRREEESALQALDAGLGMAMRLDLPGLPVRDYHTSQVPQGYKGASFASRLDEVRAPTLNTILSSRDYLCDALVTVCLWSRGGGDGPSLERIQDALARPHFALYLGRKSCPPALPLAPRRMDAANPVEALGRYGAPDSLRPLLEDRTGPVRVVWDAGEAVGAVEGRTVIRRDRPGSRKRWQFSERSEAQGRADAPHREEG